MLNLADVAFELTRDKKLPYSVQLEIVLMALALVAENEELTACVPLKDYEKILEQRLASKRMSDTF